MGKQLSLCLRVSNSVSEGEQLSTSEGEQPSMSEVSSPLCLR